MAMAEWLPAVGLDCYIYAPKKDSYLRKAWREPWPQDAYQPLLRLAQRCSETGLELGIGLSPFALYERYDAAGRRALRDRVQQINDLGDPTLALLFDDMPGGVSDLAAVQAEIAADVSDWSTSATVLVCPTYYSDDPVLDRVFGARPEGYLSELGGALPETCSLFWTGPQVCSESIAVSDLPTAPLRGGCDLALWDNYPVNDSRARSQQLYLSPLARRDPQLAGEVGWHFCNAMNQPALSLPALASLAQLYGREAPAAAQALTDAGINNALIQACAPLADTPLNEVGHDAYERLIECAKGPTMAARELAAFVAGRYTFDPDCLTD